MAALVDERFASTNRLKVSYIIILFIDIFYFFS